MTGPRDDDADRPADESADSRPDGELDAREIDERFAELVAHFDGPTWPGGDGPEEPAEDDTERPVTEAGGDPRGVRADEPTLLELWDTETPDDPDEEDFEPPAPGPMPRPSLPAILGVVLVLGGLFLVLYPTVLDVGADLGRLTGIAAFVGGAAMLIWRLRPEPDDDDPDPGNGAVV
ncbi:hypothetical protein LX16_0015 [Stackebrandtia albiflava]|uniref:DUF308 domain-containing protein n=1 Tax=Stackebrandtia albiflava TaxID=406432 RepID=A0A562VGU8_9ACTN|nr:hypothetical protein [Stackebrandtia albiflava]TWJ17100.1 hypothetical protein LX16_0015 [Stackebrandtia albiflava]